MVAVGATLLAPTAEAAPRDSAPTAARIVEPMLADSSAIPCAPGTTSVGVLDGYHEGDRTRVRLCAVSNLPASATADESNPGTKYYIKGANRRPVVNSRVSGAAFAMVEAAKRDGVALTATSSFRQDAQQRALYQCYVDQKPGCLQAAEPGYSTHQMGLALDFNLPRTYDTCDGGAAKDNPAWKWLRANAAGYGFRQLQAENWHWDTTTSNVNPVCD
jgi:hypothetical protein